MTARKAVSAGWPDDWSELRKSDGLNPWTMAKLTESYCQAKHDDEKCRSIVQQIMQRSTDFRRRFIVSVEGQGGVTLSYVCPHCHRHPREDYIWWVQTEHGVGSKSKKKQCNWWRPVQLEGLEQSLGSTGIVRVPARRLCYGAPPQGACENLVCFLKLLAKQQTGGRQLRCYASRES